MESLLYLYLSLFFALSVFHDLSVAHSFSSMQPLCHDDERSALLQFKESFLISKSACFYPSDYSKVPSWIIEEENGDCCTWDGVECSKDNGHVIGLDLSSSCLYGSINSSSSLFRLIHLERLNLAVNDFNQSKLSSELGQLSRLTYLNLSSSSFSGQIPSEILTLSDMTSLDLSDNYGLELKKPNLRSLVQHLRSLEILHLSDVSISSTVPNILANLSSLKSLDLSWCGLHGEFPAGVFQLPHLQFLGLIYNKKLTGYLPEFNRSNPLESLQLDNTSFSGELPFSIGNLASLTVLGISGANFSGSIPSSLANLSQLTTLDLSGNKFWSQNSSSLCWLVKMTKLTGLGLGEFNLNGEIPSFFANLTQLSFLDLSATGLTGQIPFLLVKLNQLVGLYLSINQLTGQIPSWLTDLPKLSDLELHSNQFTGQIPSRLMNLTQLTYLELGNNQLVGRIPSQLINLTQLTYLDLSSNKLQGSIPSSIVELKNLQYLNLASNKLSGKVELDMFAKLRSLVVLYLSSNNLSLLTKTDTNVTLPKIDKLGLGSCNLREFPNLLHSQDMLRWLDLSDNNIHGQVPKWMWNTGKNSLLFMNLSHNFLTGFEQHPLILPWTHLKILDLTSNSLEGSLPIPPSSIHFYLASTNKFTGKMSSLICNLSSLNILNLSSNHLSGRLPRCLGNFSNSLSMLDLQSNNFHGSIPQIYRSGMKLRMIDLSDNQLQGQLPRSLANCTKLEFLDFGHNQIDDIFPSWLGTLPELSVLILHSNKFHGVIGKPEFNFEFPKLRIIDLAHNHFTGKLPSGFSQYWTSMKVVDLGLILYMQENIAVEFTEDYEFFDSFDYSLKLNNKGVETVYRKVLNELTAIDLSSNRFEGEIPERIGDLKGLYMLNLSNNFFIGHIPSTLANLSALESLDISQNKLSGEIPQQLTQLTFLAFLNVSHNLLRGPIPQGKQFDTFQNSSFEGNLGLCGFQLSMKCENHEVPPLPSSTFEEDLDSRSVIEFYWIVILLGFGSGLVVGVVLGNRFTTWKHEWFARTFGRGKRRRWQKKRTCRN